MKIDIHVHTRKIKSGDAPSRNIETDRFGEILKNTDVKILAITNHNHFDLKQYEEFRDIVSDSCQIWPGIELDIFENNKRAHLLVIANPKNYALFNDRVSKILENKNPDTFTISIKETVEAFDDLDCIYIAHYFVKKPDFGDEEIEILTRSVSNPKRILKEATNSLSAGIYISHGHNSIYGSDVHDWNKYVDDSKLLPELRLDLDSFEQFCLLLEKDEATINTLLNKKVKENIEISPFTLAELIRLDIYNDINILFGSKGTGKTEILEALSKHFNGKGYKTKVYKSNDNHLNEEFDIKGSKYVKDVGDFKIKNCSDEINFIKNVTEESITSISKYLLHYSIQEKNKIAKQLKIRTISNIDDNQLERSLKEVSIKLYEFKTFMDQINIDNDTLSKYIDAPLIEELIDVLERITKQLLDKMEESFFDYHSVRMVNKLVQTFVAEIAKKTGQPEKPIKTGFAEYARNRIKIELNINKIIANMDRKIDPEIEYIGDLGLKGQLYLQTNLVIQNGLFTSSNYSPVRNVKKSTQKEFAKALKLISKHIFSNQLFEKIADLNGIEGIETISGLNDLLCLHRHFILNDKEYKPSNGESSMILLHKELQEDKDIYLIDEPEKSLGNDYINDVIVPLLKEKALLGKKIIIATHDANIAVRTLPYNSIYRLHDASQYFTLTGNPFTNTLKCINSIRPELDWKEISMKTLEGGREAFGERGKIYGN